MLIKFIDSKKDSWEDYLDTCVYAYNLAKHESSKFSPFEVMFGSRAVLPVDFDGARASEGELLVMEDFNDEELEKMMEERRARLEVVQANILLHRKDKRNSMTASIPTQMCSELAHWCWRKISLAKSMQEESWTTNGLVPTEFLVSLVEDSIS